MTNSKAELSDLRAFSDPFARASFVLTDVGWTAEFERRGVSMHLRRDGTGKIYSTATSKLLAGNFKSLLASDDFANTKLLARALIHEYLPASQDVMDIPFKVDGDTNTNHDFSQVNDFLIKNAKGAVFGLEGPAGAGKTHFIERLAAERAFGVRDGSSTNPLILPVRSAGKILSAIDDRIDGSLSALRATFTRSELPALMRNGIVSLAIDGFDELSDSRGYENSWSALRELLREVGLDGQVILSGRDSFIDRKSLQELIGNSVELSGAKLHSISVGFPSSGDAVGWLCERNTDWIERKADTLERFESYSWLRRPFFITQIARIGPRDFLDSEDEPIISLCQSMVLREVDKLEMPSHLESSRGEGIVFSILAEAARTMMDYEVDYVDATLLEVAVELACEEHAPGEENFAKALKARARSLTLLEPAPGTGSSSNRGFAHEKIKAYFYSRFLLDELSTMGPHPLGLRRTQLSLSDLAVFAALFRTLQDARAATIRDSLHRRMAEVSPGTTLASNLVALFVSSLPDWAPLDVVPVRVANQQVLDVTFPDSPVVHFETVYFNRLDVSGCSLERVTFKNCEVGEMILSDETRFGMEVPSVRSLVIEGGAHGEERIRDEAEIQGRLSKLRFSSDNTERSELFLPETLNRLVRLMLRGHWVKLSSQDQRGRRIVDRRDWPVVRLELENAGLLEVGNLGAGGRPSEFVHLKNVDEFISLGKTDEKVKAVIQRIAEKVGAE